MQQRQEEVEQAVNLTESVLDVSQQQIRQSAATAQQALINTDETKQIILQEKEERQAALEYVHKAGMRLQDTVEKISADLTIGKGQYERIKEKMVELQLKQKELQEKTDMAEEMKNHMRSVYETELKFFKEYADSQADVIRQKEQALTEANERLREGARSISSVEARAVIAKQEIRRLQS